MSVPSLRTEMLSRSLHAITAGKNRSRRDKKKLGVGYVYKEEGGARCPTIRIAHLNP